MSRKRESDLLIAVMTIVAAVVVTAYLVDAQCQEIGRSGAGIFTVEIPHDQLMDIYFKSIMIGAFTALSTGAVLFGLLFKIRERRKRIK